MLYLPLIISSLGCETYSADIAARIKFDGALSAGRSHKRAVRLVEYIASKYNVRRVGFPLAGENVICIFDKL